MNSSPLVGVSLQRCSCGWWHEFYPVEDACPQCGATGRAEVTTISDETMGRVRVVVDVAHLSQKSPVVYVRVLDLVEDVHLTIERVEAAGDEPTRSELTRVAHLVHATLASLLSVEITRRTPRQEAVETLRPIVESMRARHPTPWRVEDDWTSEVIDASGAVVAKFSSRRAAELAVAICGESDR